VSTSKPETAYGPVEITPGWEDLQKWLETPPPEGEPKRSASALARLLNISQPGVRYWVLRFSRPTEGPLRDALCRIIGSQPDRWLTAEEKDERERLAKIAPTASESEQPGAH
jgi:hypothetical protein